VPGTAEPVSVGGTRPRCPSGGQALLLHGAPVIR
jgi:hypothetical protein